jgi:hypothetical protein
MRDTLMSDGFNASCSPHDSASALSFLATMRAAPANVGLVAEYERMNEWLISVFPAMQMILVKVFMFFGRFGLGIPRPPPV